MADQQPKLPPQAGTEIGQSGTYFFKGFITAEEYSIDLQGKYALQVYDVMRRSDPTIHAALNVCKQPILGAQWEVRAASDDAKDIEIQEGIERELFKRNIVFSDFLRESLTCLDFGFSIFEEVFESVDYNGKTYIGFKKIASRKQRSILNFEAGEGIPGITQIIPSGGMAKIPREKLVYFVNDQEGDNYYGISLLRYAYKPWKIKDGLEIMNAVALEKMAMGIPQIKKGINGVTTDEGELLKLRNQLRNLRANEEAFMEMPESLSVEFMDMKGNSTKDVMPTITYLDGQILLSVLAQFLTLGQQGSAGSRAVSADHSRLFSKALTAVARTAQQAIQRDVVKRWVDLNYSDLPNGYPELIFSDISDEDTKETADAVSALVAAGALRTDRDMENKLRNTLNLPEMPRDMYDNYEVEDPAKDKPTTAPDAKDKSDDEANDLPNDKQEVIKAARIAHTRLLNKLSEE
jgi:hypothetical protein